jgi:ubiquinone/menaquinone biosynthesis C-methylase UbiE
MPDATDIVASGYDTVYEALPRSPIFQQLWREHACGADFPSDFYHISFVTLDEIRRMAADARLQPGETLADVGCGLGGPALWLARETGANLIGIDASRVAPRIATERAAALGMGDRAEFRTGLFDNTGLPDGAAAAITSEDALQYAPDKLAAFRELARVLRPGGRLVFMAFELEPERLPGVPILGADPIADYGAGLEAAGFRVETYEETAGGLEPVTAAYSAVIAAKDALIPQMGEPAVNALMGEMQLTLQVRPYRRRVFVVAERSA